jgi:membrane protein YqaA with SNARE-associated domain
MHQPEAEGIFLKTFFRLGGRISHLVTLTMGELLGLFANAFLAATILPFSSEPLFLALLALGRDPFTCFLVATVGNSLGGLTNLLLGRFSRNYFEKRGKSPRGKVLIQRYGAWIAWLSWVPFVGDPLLVAAGFYRTPFVMTAVFMVAGKAGRYVILWYFFSLTQ